MPSLGHKIVNYLHTSNKVDILSFQREKVGHIHSIASQNGIRLYNSNAKSSHITEKCLQTSEGKKYFQSRLLNPIKVSGMKAG